MSFRGPIYLSDVPHELQVAHGVGVVRVVMICVDINKEDNRIRLHAEVMHATFLHMSVRTYARMMYARSASLRS